MHRALIRFPTSEGRRWLEFRDAIETIQADDLDQVLEALARVEAHTHQGRWAVGMVSYDAGPAFDSAVRSQRNPDVPLLVFGIFEGPDRSRGPAGGDFEVSKWTPSLNRSTYEAAVAGIKEPIAAGITYQVNFTMRMRAEFSGDPLGLFEAMARAQRADHLAYLDLGDAAVCSASPELFFHRDGRRVTTRPMKGTRPRHPDPVEDQALIDDLIASPKDQAENTMIVDMMRNDLGRIAEVGSLDVPALHSIETYPTVHQMTSTVTADTDATLVELFSALFPGASITGAPKVSTSGIITEIESDPRGIYTGVVGAISPDGVSEFNIAIRTAWIDRQKGTAEYGVGGGIVWDSEPTSEWFEARHKARVLDRAQPSLRMLETMGWEPRAGATLLDRHLERLRNSAEHFGFDFDMGELRRRIEEVQAETPSRVRVLLASDGALDLEVATLDSGPATPWTLPVDTEPVDASDEFLRHKTTHRVRYAEARARFPDAPDVVLWNEDGELTETCIGNLVIELDGALVTPPVSAGLLAGTFRGELLSNEAIAESVVRLEDLERATRTFMINSVRGWVPIEIHRSEAAPTRSQ